MPHLVAFGLVCLDRYTDVDGQEHAHAGGSAGNVAAIIASRGWEASVVARAASDAVRETLTADLERWGVDTQWLGIEPAKRTAELIMHRAKNGSVRFEMLAGHEAISEEGGMRILKECLPPEVLYFDRVSPGLLIVAREWVKQGSLLYFEPTHANDKAAYEQAVQLAHIIKRSHKLRYRLPTLENEKHALVVETLGEKGLRFRLPGHDWVSLEAVTPTKVVDATGCGDWTSALLIEGLGGQGAAGVKDVTSRDEISKALVKAQEFASANCAYAGARGGMYVR